MKVIRDTILGIFLEAAYCFMDTLLPIDVEVCGIRLQMFPIMVKQMPYRVVRFYDGVSPDFEETIYHDHLTIDALAKLLSFHITNLTDSDIVAAQATYMSARFEEHKDDDYSLPEGDAS